MPYYTLRCLQMCINGMSLDLVNLRTESYANDSRVPDKVEIGTPLEGTGFLG